jgi:hypothetical protein
MLDDGWWEPIPAVTQCLHRRTLPAVRSQGHRSSPNVTNPAHHPARSNDAPKLRFARSRVGEELKTMLTHDSAERTILEWQSLAISIDRPVQRIIQSGTYSRDHC